MVQLVRLQNANSVRTLDCGLGFHRFFAFVTITMVVTLATRSRIALAQKCYSDGGKMLGLMVFSQDFSWWRNCKATGFDHICHLLKTWQQKVPVWLTELHLQTTGIPICCRSSFIFVKQFCFTKFKFTRPKYSKLKDDWVNTQKEAPTNSSHGRDQIHWMKSESRTFSIHPLYQPNNQHWRIFFFAVSPEMTISPFQSHQPSVLRVGSRSDIPPGHSEPRKSRHAASAEVGQWSRRSRSALWDCRAEASATQKPAL